MPGESVSVIIPAHNGARFYLNVINSILLQNWRDLEVIVVDDGSTDGLEKTIRSTPVPVRYLRQEQRGPAAARTPASASRPAKESDFWISTTCGPPVTLPVFGKRLNKIAKQGLRRASCADSSCFLMESACCPEPIVCPISGPVSFGAKSFASAAGSTKRCRWAKTTISSSDWENEFPPASWTRLRSLIADMKAI